MFAGFGGGVVVVVDCDDVVWFFIVQQILDGEGDLSECVGVGVALFGV